MGPAFEPQMVALFRALIRPDMVIADVGANIGMTAILFSTLARQVYSFEPSPSTFALLRQNVAVAGARNVECVNIGLGEVPQRKTITFQTQNRSGGFVSDNIRPDLGYTTEDIDIGTLDSFFYTGRPRPDFIKMDVEGFEPKVIRGARTLIDAQKPTVVLELNHFCLNVFQRVTIPDFLDLLKDIFPIVIAVDTDNRQLADVHHPDTAYSVMHAHVTQFRFPNVVCGFDPAIRDGLARLSAAANAQ